MTGRGIDQILPHSCEPQLFERWVKSALEYVALAESVSGPIPRRVGFDYIWGAALPELAGRRPDARIINLETAITTQSQADPSKGIHYRMHPANIACLTAAGIDCCVLANNHVLDWGRRGLEETLRVLMTAGIHTVGAGADAAAAAAPAIITLPNARALIYGVALPSSGVPRAWKATTRRPGVNWLAGLSADTAETLAERILRDRRRGDLVILSIHWGGNWGYGIAAEERDFAHRLIDLAGVDLVHGHSSHHPKGIEIYHRKAILYGCGDLLNDYEGIGGYESFRPELALMYFPTLDAGSGELIGLTLFPVRTRRFRIERAAPDELAWLARTLEQECGKLATRVARQSDGTLALEAVG